MTKITIDTNSDLYKEGKSDAYEKAPRVSAFQHKIKSLKTDKDLANYGAGIAAGLKRIKQEKEDEWFYQQGHNARMKQMAGYTDKELEAIGHTKEKMELPAYAKGWHSRLSDQEHRYVTMLKANRKSNLPEALKIMVQMSYENDEARASRDRVRKLLGLDEIDKKHQESLRKIEEVENENKRVADIIEREKAHEDFQHQMQLARREYWTEKRAEEAQKKER